MHTVFVSIFISLSAFAHSSGHGPELQGRGPHGGRLAAVVSAADAEKGKNAEVQAVAEWTHIDGAITLYLWEKKQQKPLVVKGPVTWILMNDKKPHVVKREVISPKVMLRLTEGVSQSKKAELILSDVHGLKGKQVVYLSW